MKTTTFYSGIKKKSKEYDVDNSLAKRWIERGIAEIIEEVKNVEVEEDKQPKAYKDMEPKDLFSLCKERGIKLEKENINGKKIKEKKIYLISKLNEFDKQEEEKGQEN